MTAMPYDPKEGLTTGELETFETAWPDSVIGYFDGLCEPKNPGGVATLGWRLVAGNPEDPGTPTDTVLAAFHGVLADGGVRATNNWAEYAAFGSLLRFVQESGYAGLLLVYGDSKLVVSQFNREWRCDAAHLQRLRERCYEIEALLTAQGCDLTVGWVPRAENALADELSERAFFQYVRLNKPHYEAEFHRAKAKRDAAKRSRTSE